MAVSYTTNMCLINLLTIVMMTFPALTSSYAQNMPWGDNYDRISAVEVLQPAEPSGYVCCNHPPTNALAGSVRGADQRKLPPFPQYYAGGKLLASLTKRDDRYAPFRWVHHRMASRQEPIPSGNAAFPAPLSAPSFERADPRSRDSRLMSLINLLGYTSSDSVDKRGAHIYSGKRNFGDVGGPNGDWDWKH